MHPDTSGGPAGPGPRTTVRFAYVDVFADWPLTGNPLTGVTLSTGVIKTVSTTGVNAARLYPVAAIRSWGTHIQNSNFAVTETASQDATFSAAEQARLQAECAAIELDGSGKGICSCGTGE